MAALKLREMQSITRAIGMIHPTSKGSFARDLSERLRSHAALGSRFSRESPTRILSIDMGVRNLAYCLLEIDSKYLSSSKDDSSLDIEELINTLDDRPSLIVQHARILEWQRLSIQAVRSINLDDRSNDQHQESKAEFKVPEYAIAASYLVLDTFLQMKPSHIVIERQRHRSGGHSAVLEWTFRVNMLEAMLYGSLSTARAFAQKGLDDGLDSQTLRSLLLWPVPPKRMSSYWEHQAERAAARLTTLGGETDSHASPDLQLYEEQASHAHAAAKSTPAQGKEKSADNRDVKLERILLASKWLDTSLKVADSAAETAAAFKTETSAGSKKPSKKIKKDDLADCLLQGIAHLCWQANVSYLQGQRLFTDTLNSELAKMKNSEEGVGGVDPHSPDKKVKRSTRSKKKNSSAAG